MDHLLVFGALVLVFAVAYLLWKFYPDFARNSSRALFMRDLANRLESTNRDTKKKESN